MKAAALLACLLIALPSLARAQSLDAVLGCRDSAHQFIEALRAQRLVEDRPVHVEDNAINTFWPTRDAHLSAFTYQVFAVIGYQENDTMFVKGRGQPLQGSLYGVVVVGGTQNVAAAIKAGGSNAFAKHAGPFLTAVVCRRM
jgi:hypothetical protein